MLALVAFAVLGVPWARLAFGRLTTRGLALAAPVGFFLFHYVAWLGLLTGWLRNGQSYAWAALGVFAAATAALAWATRADLRELWPQRRIWACGLAVLLVAYGVGVGMRWLNPEIVGTEKPMDLALLSATMRSTAFPPLDPWFAGESINYYYLGYSMGGAIGEPGRRIARGGLQHLSRHAAGPARRRRRLRGLRPGIHARRRAAARAAGGAGVGDRRGGRWQSGDRARGGHRGIPRPDGVLAGHWVERLAGHRTAAGRRCGR